jgi:hypothetical protein
MAFHVEVSSGFHRARVFNLNREDLFEKVVGPWLEDRSIEMGDREWEPRKCALKVLDGPTMESTDLSFGQGWANAERASENVTHEILAAAPAARVPDAFVIATDNPEALTAEVVAGHGGEAVHWADVRQKIDGRDPEVAAVILVVRRPSAPE